MEDEAASGASASRASERDRSTSDEVLVVMPSSVDSQPPSTKASSDERRRICSDRRHASDTTAETPVAAGSSKRRILSGDSSSNSSLCPFCGELERIDRLISPEVFGCVFTSSSVPVHRSRTHELRGRWGPVRCSALSSTRTATALSAGEAKRHDDDERTRGGHFLDGDGPLDSLADEGVDIDGP